MLRGYLELVAVATGASGASLLLQASPGVEGGARLLHTGALPPLPEFDSLEKAEASVRFLVAECRETGVGLCGPGRCRFHNSANDNEMAAPLI